MGYVIEICLSRSADPTAIETENREIDVAYVEISRHREKDDAARNRVAGIYCSLNCSGVVVLHDLAGNAFGQLAESVSDLVPAPLAMVVWHQSFKPLVGTV